MKQLKKISVLKQILQSVKVLFIISLLLLPQQLSAQNLTISGKIIDTSTNPIVGATIIVKGESRGTTSDIDGNFSIDNIAPNATLVFSFIGMKTQEIMILDNKILNVIMEEEFIGLEEVVAIGYGTIKKQDLTGSVVSVAGENLSKTSSAVIHKSPRFNGWLDGDQNKWFCK